MEFAVLAVDRHRMRTDGKGITTLVALAGCPLSCPYCINQDLLATKNKAEMLMPKQLVERLAIDHCYFLYTGGGVTFGGGEPLLQSGQIAEFSKVCPKEWSINIETSLNVPQEQLEPLLNGRFCFIIDCKAMQSDIYKKYTGEENMQVLRNLQQVVQRLPKEKYVVKVPRIPGYSGQEEAWQSKEMLKGLGIPEKNIKLFDYLQLNMDKES